ncbi:hypothetical protein [Pectinatus haikarae]|uniref:Uncharacterized protein n=1 Tax=Pectinatus haikarae TaxID=349096 RepID=A0ABT9Y3Q7_9FIRM|nr:hypothetical protein [Pectinatus haikarae]MDQ0202463.1 hypothetical protein [Pectinatus haikarae]
MALTKRCFICAHKQNDDGSCTNPDCPRYIAQSTTTESTAAATTDTASNDSAATAK